MVTFGGNTTLFPKMAAPFYNPKSNWTEFPISLHPYQHLLLLFFFGGIGV
jgi:hypothetical protein